MAKSLFIPKTPVSLRHVFIMSQNFVGSVSYGWVVSEHLPQSMKQKRKDILLLDMLGERPPALSISGIMVENLSLMLSEESRNIFWQ